MSRTDYPGAGGAYDQIAYDDVNRKMKTIDAEGNWTESTADLLGRVIHTVAYTSTNALQSEESLTYDWAGNVLTQTDGKGNVTHYGYDVLSGSDR